MKRKTVVRNFLLSGMAAAALLSGGCFETPGDDGRTDADKKNTPANASDAPAAVSAPSAAGKADGTETSTGKSLENKPDTAGIPSGSTPAKKQGLWDRLTGKPASGPTNGARLVKTERHTAPKKTLTKTPESEQGITALPGPPRRVKLSRDEIDHIQVIMNSAPLMQADSAELQQMSRNIRDMTGNLQHLQQLQKNPDPQELGFLMALAKQDQNPLAPVAVFQLHYYPGEKTKDLLENRIESPSPDIRQAALTSLYALDEEQAVRRARKLLSDPDPKVLSWAALTLGMAQDRQSAPALGKLLKTSQPGVAIFVAWAMLRCAEERSELRDQAVQYLKDLCRSDSARFAVQAVYLLRNQPSREVISLLYDALYSRWNTIMLAAAETLSTIPPEDRQRALGNYSVQRQQLLENRLNLLLYLAGRGPLPTEYADCLSSPDITDRRLALECIARQNNAADIPDLILLLHDPAEELRIRTTALLRDIIRENGMTAGPDDAGDQMAWCRWWLRQYRVLAATDQKALVQGPGQQPRELTPGQRLDFRARVKYIRPGALPDGRDGARVELDLGGEPLLLQP